MPETAFLSHREHKKIIQNWREAGSFEKQSSGILPYNATRTEKEISLMHDISFVNFLNEKLKEQRKDSDKKEKLRVLDVGGGASLFAAQLRQIFKSDISVYSTGLAKKPIRKFRRFLSTANKEDLSYFGLSPGISNKLLKSDLKWRSILDLKSEKPEFDLIVDTYGEQSYGFPDDVSGLKRYINACIAKLKSGGMISIYPYGQYIEFTHGGRLRKNYYNPQELFEFEQELSKSDLNIEKIIDGQSVILRIRKL